MQPEQPRALDEAAVGDQSINEKPCGAVVTVRISVQDKSEEGEL